MDPAVSYALSAVVSFWLNLAQVMVLLTIIAKWFAPDVENKIVLLVHYMMNKFYDPIRVITRFLGVKDDIAPFVMLALIIPMQMILVPLMQGTIK
ncbi:MAG: hypothetical protein CMP10_06150 [Zetaproteobacteria bacterium]|nr:hypothetical protein [Pseudobdellovibrionaceae bacterium]|tara:strand:+ start:1087 stop:1371 length:285 start_codon:yes stop_codon:yes gene_type:complete